MRRNLGQHDRRQRFRRKGEQIKRTVLIIGQE
jgi:hypothetical protein